VAEKITPMEVVMAKRAFSKPKPNEARAMGSVGAAGVEPPLMRQANIEEALAKTSPETNAFVLSQDQANINLPALQIKSLEDKHGVQLTLGQRTGQTGRYAQEWNSRGGEGNPLGERFGDQPAQIAQAIDNARVQQAPDINELKPSALGQLEIDGLTATDNLRQSEISIAYKNLSDENGGRFPIDPGKLEQNVGASLDKFNLLPYFENTPFQKSVDKFYADPSFQRFEALRTQSANILRSNADGNIKKVAFLVRQELENMPVFGEGAGTPQAIKLKKLADVARALVVERSDIIKGTPAYRAAIGEAVDADSAASQGQSLNAADFHGKYVSLATPEAVRRLKAQLLPDDKAHQALIAGEFERAKNQILNASENSVSSDKFAKFLKNNDDLLREAMGPQAFNELFEIGILSGKIGMPKAGVFNYSNSYSALASELATKGLLSAAEMKLAADTAGMSLPATGALRSLSERFSKNRFAAESLNPMGGLTLQKTGKVDPYKAARSTYGPRVDLKDVMKQAQPTPRIDVVVEPTIAPKGK
jgi:predicted nucleotide-binding protein